MTPLRLAAGALSLEVRPDLGGAVTRFDHAGVPILRPTPADAAPGPAAAAFALAPFPNRIANGRFRYDGRDIVLPPDPDGAPHALHGEAWRAAWTVHAADAACIDLIAPPARVWPWTTHVRQRLVLTREALTVTLTVRNADDRPMPAGLGWHPAFARRPAAQLTFAADGYLPTDAAQIPVATPAPLAPRWPFPTGASGADIAPIDHCLVGWDGAALLEWSDFTVRMAARTCRFLQIYAPTGGDFVCIEPQTCTPDAVNRGPDSGLIQLAPSASLTLEIVLSVVPR